MHVSASHVAIIRHVRHEINYYVSCIIATTSYYSCKWLESHIHKNSIKHDKPKLVIRNYVKPKNVIKSLKIAFK
jgi:hypothetical protein